MIDFTSCQELPSSYGGSEKNGSLYTAVRITL